MIALVEIEDGIIEYAGKVYVEVPDGYEPVFVQVGEMDEFDAFAGYYGNGMASD